MIPILYLHETAQVSGAENSLLNLIRHLNPERFNPYFVCSEPGPLVDELKKINLPDSLTPKAPVTVIPLPRIWFFWVSLSSILKLNRIVRKFQIKVIHSNSIRTHLYSAVLAKLNGISCVWHQRNLITTELIDPDKLLSFLPNKIVCNSQAIAHRFASSGSRPLRVGYQGKEKVVVIYNGVDISRFDPTVITGDKIRKEFGIRKDEIVIGIISRLGPDKGHEIFIYAADKLITNNELQSTNLRFLIVGDAVFARDRWREQYLRQLAVDLGVKKKVIFTGKRTDIPEIIASVDIMVLTAYAEPCGRVVLETMAMAKPIIATNTGGTPELVVDKTTGILIPPGDVSALSASLEFLIKTVPIRQQMGIEARKRIESMFTIKTNVKKTEQLYQTLVYPVNNSG